MVETGRQMETGRTVRPRVVIIGAGFGGLAVRPQAAERAGRRRARRPAQLPPVHAAAVPSCELPARARAKSRRRCARCSVAPATSASAWVTSRASTSTRAGRAPRRRRRSSRTTIVVLAAGQSHELLRQRRSRAARARAEGSRRGAATAQPRARLPRAGDERRPMPTNGAACSRSASSAAVRPASSTRARSPSSCGWCFRRSIRRSRITIVAHRACSKGRSPARHVQAAAVRVRARESWSGAVSTCARTRSSPSADDKFVRTRDGGEIETATMIWTAGVQPPSRSPWSRRRRTRAPIASRSTSSSAFPASMARSRSATRPPADDKHGAELPMTSPPAMQAGRYVARQILGRSDRASRSATSTRARWRRSAGPRRSVRSDRCVHRLHRLGRVARRAPLLPDRLREPADRDAAMVLVLRALRPARARDHPRPSAPPLLMAVDHGECRVHHEGCYH